jgi:hypothetical protein
MCGGGERREVLQWLTNAVKDEGIATAERRAIRNWRDWTAEVAILVYSTNVPSVMLKKYRAITRWAGTEYRTFRFPLRHMMPVIPAPKTT